jgi:hypothetical protein
MLSEFSWLTETADRTGRLRELAVVLVASLREHRNVIVVDEDTGPALAEMMQRVAPMSPRGKRSAKLTSAALASIELLDEILSTDFALIADPEAYAPLAVVSRWWQPSSYPQSVTDQLSGVIRKLTSAIRLRARLVQKSESLTLRLRQALGADGSVADVLAKIAETETGLAPEIDDWLRGRSREISATVGAIQSLLSEAGAPAVTERIASLLLDCFEVELTTIEDSKELLSPHLRRIFGRIRALATELKLTIDGVVGEIVEFNPNAHRTISGGIPSDPLVRLRRPMVVRQRDDGSRDIVERALVEDAVEGGRV